MTPQEMIAELQIDPTPPPWDGEVMEVRATVMVNRRPVRVRVLDIYKYWGRKMARVEALQGKPFRETNLWRDTLYADRRNVQVCYLRDIALVY